MASAQTAIVASSIVACRQGNPESTLPIIVSALSLTSEKVISAAEWPSTVLYELISIPLHPFSIAKSVIPFESNCDPDVLAGTIIKSAS